MRIKNRLILYFSFLSLLPMIVVALLTLGSAKKNITDLVIQDQKKFINEKIEIVKTHLSQFINNAHLTSEYPPIQGLIRARETGIDPIDKSTVKQWCERLAEIFSSMIRTNNLIEHINYVDENGQELVKVTRKNQKPVVMPKEKLQNKSHRYYFKEALKRPKGEIYISNMDLNQEFGKIETPYKPVIRFVKAIYDNNNKKRGIISIAVSSRKLLKDLGSFASGKILFLDQDGYFLIHPNKEKEFSRNLKTSYNYFKEQPEIVENLKQTDEKQFFDKNENQYRIWEKIYFDEHHKDRFWILISIISQDQISGSNPLISIYNIQNFTIILMLILGGASLFYAIYFSQSLSKPIKNITDLAQNIAKGDLDSDYTSNKKIRTKEISYLETSILKMRSNLKSFVERIQKAKNSEIQQRLFSDTLIQESPYGILLLDENNDVKRCNSTAKKIFGYEPDVTIQTNIKTLIPNLLENLETLLKNHADKNEFLAINTKSLAIPVKVIATRISQNKNEYTLLSIVDISREKELQLQTNRLLDIINKSPDYICITNVNGSIFYANKALLKALKIESFSENSLNLSKIFSEDELQKIQNEAIPEALKNGFHKVENTFFHKLKNEEIVVNQLMISHKNERGDVKFLSTVMRDITAQKRNIQKLKMSEARFRSSFEYSGIGIALVSPEGQFLKTNKALVDILGYAEEELIQKDFQSITHAEDLKKDLEFVEQVLNGTLSSYNMEKRYLTKNRGYVWSNLTVSLVRDFEKNPLYFIAQIQDINDHKINIEKLKQTNEELEQFAYVASHDLQEPLRKITSFSELLSESLGDKLEDDDKTYFSYMTDAATRMKDLIQDLLSFSRSNTTKLEKQKVESSDLVKMSLENLETSIKENQAQITFDDLPEINCSKGLITQVFQNIIGNAMKFVEKDKTPKIHISAKKQNHDWLFAIEDNGIGIDPEFQNKIFEIFKRLHRRSEYSGTGIGLAICKKIIERHGGKIWIESTPKVGTTFFFTLPIN